MKRFIINIIIFGLIIFAADYAIGAIAEWLSATSQSGETKKRHLVQNVIEPEILILGSSRSVHHYDPAIISDSLHMSTFVAGEDGNGIITMYPILRKVAERKHPSIVIYDFIPGFDLYEDDLNKYLKIIRPIWGENEAIDSTIVDIDSMERYKLISKSYKYNSGFIALLKDKVKKTGNVKDGYIPTEGEMTTYTNKNNNDQKQNRISSKKEEYLNQLVRFCKDESIELIFIISPYYNFKDKYSTEFISQLAKKNGLRFLDYSNAEPFHENMKLFKDSYHMNHKGAELFSSRLSSDLKQITNNE